MIKTLKGSIIINASYSNENLTYQSERIKAELENLGTEAEIVKNDNSVAFIENGKAVNRLKYNDFAVFLDKDVNLCESLEKSGVKCFNPSQTIAVCDDKYKTFLSLCGENINIPKTIKYPTKFFPSKDNFTEQLTKELSFPIVVKKNSSSQGKGVYLATNKDELDKICLTLQTEPHSYQEYIGEQKIRNGKTVYIGRDIRVIAIGGKAVCAMERLNENDFRSNVALGGQGKKYPLTQEIKLIAERICKKLGLYYAGIDLLPTKNGFFLCEVNSNAYFSEAEKVCNVNIAQKYAEFIVKSLTK